MTYAVSTANQQFIAAQRRSIFIVDDNAVLRMALELMLEREPDLCVCGTAESVDEALMKIRECAPDAAIIDLTLKNGSGIDLILELRRQYPEMPLLVLSMHDETLFGSAARAAGANAYVMKHQASDKLLAELRRCIADAA
jgi:DNA-binding NarL/FixJ family response regulator